MKMTRTLFIAAFALLPLLGSAQNCAASFKYSTNGLTVTFDGSLAQREAQTLAIIGGSTTTIALRMLKTQHIHLVLRALMPYASR